ncbi:MAG: SDR family oxidoreductase [Candidatus Hodarchaeales archaeon]|jgi:NAD(P)-dependent dehydrogenase (short-subunit alcohol dehydrogenase family)
MKLEGRVALITGGGSGIGRATALLFAKEGAKVAISDRNPPGGRETIEMIHQLGYDAIFIEGDVSADSDAEKMVKETVRNYKKLDLLFNNAGVMVTGEVINLPEKDWDIVINTNLKGIFLVSKYAIPEMLKSGNGVIVNMSSALGLVGMKNHSAYCASKGGVIALTKAMALDYAPNIRVNCLCPAAITTPMMEKGFANSNDPESIRKEMISLHPVGRLGTPDDVAYAVLFLASEDSSFITGSALVLDGGAIAK